MMELCKPSLHLLPSYLEFIEEMRERGETVWDGMIPKTGETPHAFVQSQIRAETHPEPGMVPQTSYWGVITDQVVGRIRQTRRRRR